MVYIPNQVVLSIHNINFSELYANGKRIILFDIDNTLVSYANYEADEKLQQLFKKLDEIGFKTYLISNNNITRIQQFETSLNVKGALPKARKPFSRRLKYFLLRNNIDASKTVAIGDQILTDLPAFAKLQLDVIIVKSIDRNTEKWYTRINRLREKYVIKRITKKDPKIGRMLEALYE